MISDVTKLENYANEMKKKSDLSMDDHIFMQTKINTIKEQVAALEQKVSVAETKEKLGIQRQEVFGDSQTKVESERHKNIMAELEFMAKNNITVFNRSSYPDLARHLMERFKRVMQGIIKAEILKMDRILKKNGNKK